MFLRVMKPVKHENISEFKSSPSSIPYQLGYKASNVGKRISSTKYKFVWQFGLSNDDALKKGMEGSACCGETHEVILFWSVRSGKRRILVDGIEKYFSVEFNKRLEADFTICGNRSAKVIRFLNGRKSDVVSLVDDIPVKRPVITDFWLNGISFFDMPTVNQLGTKPEYGKIVDNDDLDVENIPIYICEKKKKTSRRPIFMRAVSMPAISPSKVSMSTISHRRMSMPTLSHPKNLIPSWCFKYPGDMKDKNDISSKQSQYTLDSSSFENFEKDDLLVSNKASFLTSTSQIFKKKIEYYSEFLRSKEAILC